MTPDGQGNREGRGRDGRDGTSDRRRRPPGRRAGKGGDRGKGGRKAPIGGRDRRPAVREETRLTIPSTPQRVLFKGIDCEVNGRRDLAMYLYLHGAAMLSGGCESNAERMLREMGRGEFPTVRGRVSKECSEAALVAFDYICSTIDEGYDDGFLRSKSGAGDPFATYCLIRLGKVDADDPAIDAFASAMESDEGMVEQGLELLVRKKDSVRAEGHLRAMAERRRQRQAVRPAFLKALKGDASGRERLERLSGSFKEAGFLLGYLDAEDGESYIRDGLPEFNDTVMSVINELGMSDRPFGMYLSAKRLQAEGGDWIPPMVRAFAAGSEEAFEELRPVQNRKDVRRAMSAAFLSRDDAAGLVRCYDGQDRTYLDRYCAGDPARISEVAGLMGGQRALDWLKANYRDGVAECRDMIVSMASSGSVRGKQMVYALHDVGADMEAARMYLDMYGDPSLPSVKWLSKVCGDDETREYVRGRLEEMGEAGTFEYIMSDDGYDSRHRGGRKGRR